MSQQLVLIAIGVVVAAFILRPLLRGRAGRITPKPALPVPVAPASEELNELELDRAMGRISAADYARWRRELEAGAPDDAPTEAATAAPPPADGTTEAEALVRHWREAPRPSDIVNLI